MSIKFKEQYFNFGKVLETNVNNSNPSKSFAKVTISSKEKIGEEKVYSDWIAYFKKDALFNLDTLQKGDFIKCNGKVTRVGKTDESGKRVWHQDMVVWEWVKWEKVEENQNIPQETEEDEHPF